MIRRTLGDDRGGLSIYWIICSLLMFTVVGMTLTIGQAVVVRQALAERGWAAARYAAYELDEATAYRCSISSVSCEPRLDTAEAATAATAYLRHIGFSDSGAKRAVVRIVDDHLIVIELEADYRRILILGQGTVSVTIGLGASPHLVSAG